MVQPSHEFFPENKSGRLNELLSLGPEAQGEIDETLLQENLKRTPAERLIEAGRAATQIEQLREALRVSKRG